MIPQVQSDKFHFSKSRNKLLRNMIIQKGPFLFKFDSMQEQGLKINIKKINLEHRPESLHCLTQRKSTLPSPKVRISLESSISRYQYKGRCFNRELYRLIDHPFQNEALKIPLNKRSFSVTRKIKN